MKADPIFEWQRLTAHYRELSDEELRELAYDFSDLTEQAQQALSQEMRSRGLGDARPVSQASQFAGPAPTISRKVPAISESVDEASLDSEPMLGHAAGVLGVRAPQLVPDDPDDHDSQAEEEAPHEYTWKILLCECETSSQARQLVAALRQAGIDSWVDGPASGTRYRSASLASPCVVVAADQLDQARAIAAQTHPQEIVEDEKEEEVPEFVEPKCPSCGSDDLVLEGVDPANSWRCEHCDEQWTENSQATAEDSPKT
jgi:hypothetical protein